MNNEPIDFINNKEDINVEVKELFNEYYKLFNKIKNDKLELNKYNVNDYVLLKKGTLLHGIKSYNKEKIENIKNNGILFGEYNGFNTNRQQRYCVCFWIMNKDVKLRDYVNYYSGDTIFLKERFKKNKFSNIYIPCNPYDGRNEIFKKINKFKYEIYYVHESKENRFMPSLTNFNKSEDDYIAFIINNKYTNKILDYDIYHGKIALETIKQFLSDWVVNSTIINKICTQTDHEIAITFGIPSNLIEGILVGKLVEKDEEKLKEIKEVFPECYICNLEGVVIK